MKKIRRLLSVLLAIVLIIGVVPISSITSSAADKDIKNVQISSSGMLYWNSFRSGNNYYIVKLYGKRNGVDDVLVHKELITPNLSASFDLFNTLKYYNCVDGEYRFELYALNSAIDYESNRISNIYKGSYTFNNPIPVLRSVSSVHVDGSYLVWDMIPYAEHYVVDISLPTSGYSRHYYVDTNSIDLRDYWLYGSVNYRVSITPRAEYYTDGMTYTNSALNVDYNFPDYKVSFDANGGSVNPSYKKTDGDTRLSSFPIPTREHASFAGWYDDPSGGIRVDENYKFSGDTTIYAHWNMDSNKKISFQAMGGSVDPLYTYTDEEGYLTYLPTPTKDGWVFNGWHMTPVNDYPVEIGDKFDSDKMLYAHWRRPSSYYPNSVLFDANGGDLEGKAVRMSSVNSANKLDFIPTPTREGYRFVGWYTGIEDGSIISYDTVFSEKYTDVYARWSDVCSISFEVDGGSSIAPATVKYGTKVSKPSVPTKEGYIFDNWYIDSDRTAVFDFNTAITASITLYAKWNKSEKNDSGREDSKNVDSGSSTGNSTSYSNEWVDGKWYASDGSQTYESVGQWKCDSSGWWFEDSSGWYPVSTWQKIDGKWYYFTSSGYMDYSEYRDGYWLGADGAWVESYSGGHWCSDSNGWWYEDASGWYPVNQYVWIDGVNYWFGADGYWK